MASLSDLLHWPLEPLVGKDKDLISPDESAEASTTQPDLTSSKGRNANKSEEKCLKS